MLSTFTTEHGALIIRTQDVRRIEDMQQADQSVACVVEWSHDDGSSNRRSVIGTARENLERLQREELEAVERFKRAEQRQSQGLPALPIMRGGKAGR